MLVSHTHRGKITPHFPEVLTYAELHPEKAPQTTSPTDLICLDTVKRLKPQGFQRELLFLSSGSNLIARCFCKEVGGVTNSAKACCRREDNCLHTMEHIPAKILNHNQ
jgi:hypothetical protein